MEDEAGKTRKQRITHHNKKKKKKQSKRFFLQASILCLQWVVRWSLPDYWNTYTTLAHMGWVRHVGLECIKKSTCLRFFIFIFIYLYKNTIIFPIIRSCIYYSSFLEVQDLFIFAVFSHFLSAPQQLRVSDNTHEERCTSQLVVY